MKLNNISNWFFHNLFLFNQKLGFHITRNHFYHPIPDTRLLNDELWINDEISGVKLDQNRFLDMLSEFSVYKDEYDQFTKLATSSPHQYFSNNGSFQAVDGDVYYCMIRNFKPKRIIEVGSGFSTYLAAQALLKNEEEDGTKGQLISIDPYPNQTIKKGFPGLSKLIESKVEDLDISIFKTLQNNDILFIDSSHVLKIGSDVQYEYLKLLPNINKGVLVHIHDIFLPLEYPKDWIFKHHRFWNEQYLLQAFLSFNNVFEILWPGHYMSIYFLDKLKKVFPSCSEKNLHVSFWMKRRL